MIGKTEQNRLQKEAELYELAKSIGYIIKGEYVNTTTKILMTCDKGHDFETIPKIIRRGGRCAACRGCCPKAAEKDFRDLAESIGYNVNGEYITTNKKISMTCEKGHDIEISPGNLKSGKRCAVCSGKSSEAAKKIFEDIAASIGYTVNGEYVSSHVKTSITCEKGHRFDMTPNNFKRGQRCPYCADHGFDQGKEASLYLYRWTLGGKSFIKYGVTNYDNHDKRIKQQAVGTKYTPELIKEVRGKGKDIWAAERIIKEELGGKFVSSEIFGDGFTETLEDNEQNISFIEDLMKEI